MVINLITNFALFVEFAKRAFVSIWFASFKVGDINNAIPHQICNK